MTVNDEVTLTGQAPPQGVLMDERLDELLEITRSLTKVIEDENDALRQRRPSESKALTEEKGRLSLLYTREFQIVQKHKASLAKTDKSRRLALKDATEAFHDALDRNERLLARLRKVTEGLIEAVGEEVVRQSKPVAGYGRDAKVDAKAAGAATLALNETI